MIDVYLDCETYPFVKEGKATKNPVPRLVCMAYIEGTEPPRLVDRTEALALFLRWLRSDRYRIINMHTTFDILVLVRALVEDCGGDYSQDVFKDRVECPNCQEILEY